jgi:HlyD family secretion protein
MAQVKRKKRRWLWYSLAGILLVFIGLAATGKLGKKKETQVAVTKAEKRKIIQTVTGAGKIFPEVEVKVSPDVSGEIVELNVKAGDTVRKGQVLGKIYADIYSSQRDQAASEVNRAQAGLNNSSAAIDAIKAREQQAIQTFEANKKLYTDGVISRIEFEQFQTNLRAIQSELRAAVQGINANKAVVQSARTQLSQANANLGRTTIFAPMDGIVSYLAVKKGERVVGTAQMAGTEMLRIAKENAMETVVDVSENDIAKVKLGDTAEIQVDAYVGRVFKGIVTQITNSSGNLQNTNGLNAGAVNDVTNYKVHVHLIQESYQDLIRPNVSFPFRDGMTANVKIITNTKSDVLTIPINAVTTRSPENEQNGGDKKDEIVVFVYEANTQKVKKVKVTYGIQDIDNYEILSGLNEGDLVVSEPFAIISKELKTDMKVKVVDKKDLFKTN